MDPSRWTRVRHARSVVVGAGGATGGVLGRTLGHYRVLAEIGQGGMGRVYRARDEILDREVAIKVLPEEFASSGERLKRFEREARLIAALNHPNVATIHGLERDGEVRFLVLELVEGETLRDRLQRGRVPMQEALRLALQIAEALEAAHEKGVVHRDLKPANVKLTPGGRVKVLDFGLAKSLHEAGPDPGRPTSDDPTATDTTGVGAVMGTPRYMSPEQVSGESVDARSDIWAFGVVLWELLTGAHLFEGRSSAQVMAAIVRDDPDWRRLPGRTPETVRLLLRRCLAREVRDRLPAIREARILIQGALAPAVSWARFDGRSGARWALPILAAALGSAGLIWLARRDTGPRVPRLGHPVQVSSALGEESYPTWSPDGRTIAYESDETGNWDIWVAFAGGGGAANRTADNTGYDRYPSWSPDGSQIAFLSLRAEGPGYYVMPALGGTPRRVAGTPFRAIRGDPAGTERFGWYWSPPAWSADGRELACINYRAEGDAVKPFIEIVDVVTLDARRLPLPTSSDTHRDLAWSGDQRFFAYAHAAVGSPETSQLHVLRPSDGENLPVTDGQSWVWSPSWSADARHLDYVSNRGGAADLWRQRMDAAGRPVGDPVALTTALEMRQARFSPDGAKLAFARGRWVSNVWRVPILEDRPATWQDAEQITFDQAFIEFLDVSPDGRRMVFSSDRAGNQDLWIAAVGGGAGDLVRLTTDTAPEWYPCWSPDGERVAFYSLRSGNRQVWVMPARGGAATRVTHNDTAQDAGCVWSPDGQALAYWSDRTGAMDVWVTPLAGGPDRQLTDAPSDDYPGGWSPDGRWILFTSNREGAQRIWRVAAGGGEPERLSSGPGVHGIWSRDGTRVYFIGTGERADDLWMVSLEDESERAMTDLAGRRGWIGLAALGTDGRFLYFTWRNDVSDIWVMDMLRDGD